MPQLSRGGKFIFGESQIRPDGCVRFRLTAQAENRPKLAFNLGGGTF